MTSIIDHRSNDVLQADRVIYITALDTRGDWFADYVDAVEAESGLSYAGDESQYGVFLDDSGRPYQAFVDESRSNDDEWCVHLDRIAD